MVNPWDRHPIWERDRPRGPHRRDGMTERGQIQWLGHRQLSACALGSMHRTVSLTVPLRNCRGGRGRTRRAPVVERISRCVEMASASLCRLLARKVREGPFRFWRLWPQPIECAVDRWSAHPKSRGRQAATWLLDSPGQFRRRSAVVACPKWASKGGTSRWVEPFATPVVTTRMARRPTDLGHTGDTPMAKPAGSPGVHGAVCGAVRCGAVRAEGAGELGNDPGRSGCAGSR